MYGNYFVFMLLISQAENVDIRKGLFATKTPFRHHASTEGEGSGEGLSPRIFDVMHSTMGRSSGCHVQQINALFRHGIRYPSPKDIMRGKKFFSMIKDNLTPDNGFHELSNWTSRFALSLAKELTEKGAGELRHFGKQYGHFFSSVSYGKAMFISSSVNRTQGSCSSFQDGFFETSNLTEYSGQNRIKCIIQNDTIRFFDECKKYLEKVKQGYREYDAFKHSTEIDSILDNFKIQWKLNVTGVTYKELKAAYATAGTEISNFGTSPWLELFSKEDLEILEYASDLKGYWKKGYGIPINFEMSCVLLRDVFLQLDEAVNNQTGEHYRGVFRFGHSETLLPLLCLLGLYKDDVPLRADNFMQQKNRNFKAGFLSPFAANLAFFLYKCDSSQETDSIPTAKSEFTLMLVHNERPVHFPCCPDQLICPYRVVREYYSRWIDDCIFGELCDLNEQGSNQSKEEL